MFSALFFAGGGGAAALTLHSLASMPSVDQHVFASQGDLAFVSLGDLYVLDGATGRVVNVTGLGRSAGNSSYSSDGKWLIYETNQGRTWWLASGNGADSKHLAGSAAWLVGDEVRLTTSEGSLTYEVTNTGTLRQLGGYDHAQAVAIGGQKTYVFVTDTLQVHAGSSSRGVVRVTTSNSALGKQTPR